MMDSPTELSFAAAFMLGLLGNVHCIAMCGGVVAAFSQAPPGGGSMPLPAAARPLVYNVGRITSYVVAGAIAGAGGLLIAEALGATGAFALRCLFGVIMIGVGLYLAGWTRALAPIERAAAPVWRVLSRGIRPLLPADRAWKAFALGAIWGWLPCGLVYAALVGAAASGSARTAALLMLSFGVGTLPALLAAGALAEGFGRLVRRSEVRVIAGIAVLLFGFWTLGGAVAAYRHWGHAPGSESHEEHPHHDHAAMQGSSG